MKPFLKWPGGKRWLTNKHAHLFPKKFDTYIEPFLGSGSVFFHLAPKKALLGDTNQELIATYSGLRDDPMAVEDTLLMHEMNHCEAYYYSVRNSRPRTSHMKAARFIYLNRTCFNGIYRVNLNGTFNVPKGISTLLPSLVRYEQNTGTAKLAVRQRLQQISLDTLENETGLSRHTILRARRGERVHPRSLQILRIAASRVPK
jgi:DNA adenine methylase Dam